MASMITKLRDQKPLYKFKIQCYYKKTVRSGGGGGNSENNSRTVHIYTHFAKSFFRMHC